MCRYLFSISMVLFLASATAVFALGNCAQNKFGHIICAPPGGTIMLNKNDEVVCGLGKCVVNKAGIILCSSRPGGSAIIDIMGNSVCAGACVSASERYCQGKK